MMRRTSYALFALLLVAESSGFAAVPKAPLAVAASRRPAAAIVPKAPFGAVAASRRPAPVRMDATTAEKAAAASAYLLPALDGFQYGVYVYQNIPPVGEVAFAMLPYVNAFQSIPFAGLILFFGLSFFTRNQGLSRFVRFNIQQALILDIVLLIPSFFGSSAGMFPPFLQAMGSNFVFYLCAGVISYSWVAITIGKTPDQVPIISDAASMQIGPY